jgi:glucose/arabinose dehydrogenase
VRNLIRVRRRRSIAAGAVAALALAACSGEDAAPPEQPTVEPAPDTVEPTTSAAVETEPAPTGPLRVRLETVATGLEAPVHVAVAPGEPERLYVVERAGRIRAVEDGRVSGDPFLDIVELVTSGGEQGLLSVAFHPDYERNRRFYVDYTDVGGDTVVAEYRARDGAAARMTRRLLAVDQPYVNHNGGQLAFGPDGLLYVGMGDGGAAGDPENRAQDLESRLGKLLRLDVDRAGAEWEVVAYGLRNPWRFSFDRETDDLWIGDVGQGEWEEIDLLPAGTDELVNFGWDVREGTHPFEDKEPTGRGRLVDPVTEYSHAEGCSVTGGFVYRGEEIPAAVGRYFFGDYCSGAVWALTMRDGRTRTRRLPFEVAGLSSFGEDERGELYLASLDGSILRLAPR